MISFKGPGFIRWTLASISLSIYLIAINCSGHNNINVNYVKPTDCLEKASADFILTALDNVTPAECAVSCDEMYQCMLFFYNSDTRYCSLHNRTMPDIRMVSELSSDCYVSDDIVESWIVEIVEVSSSLDSDRNSSNMIGQPDGLLWAPSSGRENDFTEVRFSSEMYIEQIDIYERGTAGGVSRISLLTPGGAWYAVWTTDQLDEVGTGRAGRIMSPILELTHFKASIARIDTGIRSYREYIDAVRIRGRRQRLNKRVYAP